MAKSPIVLFLFKRSSTLPQIIARIKEYLPTKIYLIADGPRNTSENSLVLSTRSKALELIDWDCEVIENYVNENHGVYDRIGKGANWVFEREDRAIFLEDDNLPESTFFKYCDTLLDQYEDNPKIAWICGTNYLEDSSYIGEESYYYTRHLLPCGWASWSKKFRSYYDGELETLNNYSVQRMSETYIDKRLFKQELHYIYLTKFLLNNSPKSASWDRQMIFSIRSKLLYGIAPKYNQIKNIGADELSTHGGTNLKKEMTFRFCERSTFPLQFPLTSPTEIKINKVFERKIGSIILQPFNTRILFFIGRIIKIFLRLPKHQSLTYYFKRK